MRSFGKGMVVGAVIVYVLTAPRAVVFGFSAGDIGALVAAMICAFVGLWLWAVGEKES